MSARTAGFESKERQPRPASGPSPLGNCFMEPVGLDSRLARLGKARASRGRREGGRLTMDRAKLVELLARAERHIALGKEQIDSQYRIIAELESDGHDTTAAIDLLRQFIETQELHERDRDRLVSKLAGGT